MKLHLPEILHIIDRKPMILSHAVVGAERVVDARHPSRDALRRLVPLMHKAEKFVFDSGSDQDARTVDAVRQTAVAMLEAKLFRMPHPLMWIEDPYTDVADDLTRNFYLVQESSETITIHFLQRMDSGIKDIPSLVYHVHPLVIDLLEPADAFLTPTATAVDALNAKVLGEAVYSVKKLVVALNTRDILIERVQRAKERTGGDLRRRTYAHSVVRVPFETTARGEAPGEAGARRRKHLVRGYIYGKGTRPVEQQRWVKPYWRGDAEVGTVQRSHYAV